MVEPSHVSLLQSCSVGGSARPLPPSRGRAELGQRSSCEGSEAEQHRCALWARVAALQLLQCPLSSSLSARSSNARLWQLADGQQIPLLHPSPARACELIFFFILCLAQYLTVRLSCYQMLYVSHCQQCRTL